jgi:hypothetical protein
MLIDGGESPGHGESSARRTSGSSANSPEVVGDLKNQWPKKGETPATA